MPNPDKTVAVVGAGLAGLAAGCALADAGLRVTLFERRPYVGGRASSYEHPGTGEVVDNCQHVLLGCCTNLIHFYEHVGAGDKVRWFDELTFIEPGGRASKLGPSPFWLPAPLHAAPSFLRAKHLALKDKLAIARGLTAMMGKLPQDEASEENFLQWLRRHGQTERAIERFWKVVLVSALNEDLDRMSVRYAVQVFRESFLKSAGAGKMGVPRVPLSDLYGQAAEYISSRGGEVRLRSAVNSICQQKNTDAVTINTSSGDQQFDFAVLAVPFQAAASLLPLGAPAEPLKADLEHFQSSPITGVHLWFDREITPLPHGVLLDRTIQWMFQKSKLLDAGQAAKSKSTTETRRHGEQTDVVPPPSAVNADQSLRLTTGSYLELVVSASKSLVSKSREEVLDLAVAELADFFPIVKQAKVLKAAVIKEIYATYSILPGLDRYRPEAKTPWPRVFLAGDWTATDWPATMEGAVRSGYLAAEALAESMGNPQKFLAADLPAKGLMRMFE
jgi:zeta-carotene desaturase